MKAPSPLRWPSRSPAARWPQPDFLPPPERPPMLAWLWLVCAALALGLALDDWLALDAERNALHSQLERLPTPRQSTAPRAAAAPAAAQNAATLAAAQALVRRLDHPWRTLFESTEGAAAPGVHWLRLEHDAERGEVHLEATAAHRDTMVDTLDALAATPGWRDVMLMRVEALDTPLQPSTGVRFELRARRSGDAPAAGRVDSP